mmetsp:Transcript_32401/g.103085  ORF Transcript_32401/g.103085 Transcript_32401/m.103085 type:complete len:275 (-) Transcript_32401:1422-2246(-)
MTWSRRRPTSSWSRSSRSRSRSRRRIRRSTPLPIWSARSWTSYSSSPLGACTQSPPIGSGGFPRSKGVGRGGDKGAGVAERMHSHPPPYSTRTSSRTSSAAARLGWPLGGAGRAMGVLAAGELVIQVSCKRARSRLAHIAAPDPPPRTIFPSASTRAASWKRTLSGFPGGWYPATHTTSTPISHSSPSSTATRPPSGASRCVTYAAGGCSRQLPRRVCAKVRLRDRTTVRAIPAASMPIVSLSRHPLRSITLGQPRAAMASPTPCSVREGQMLV